VLSIEPQVFDLWIHDRHRRPGRQQRALLAQSGGADRSEMTIASGSTLRRRGRRHGDRHRHPHNPSQGCPLRGARRVSNQTAVPLYVHRTSASSIRSAALYKSPDDPKGDYFADGITDD